ncbi:MAG: four helix bundle suffix domain-containing protein, partial [Acidobacteriota bacterium]
NELVQWVERERRLSLRNKDRGNAPSSQELVANATLSLLNLCCYLLDRQLKHLADSFENEGGFTERMYRFRTRQRRQD